MSKDLKLQLILSAMDRVTAPLKKIMGGSSATTKNLKELNNRLKELDIQQKQVSKMQDLYRSFQATRNSATEAQKKVYRLAQEMRRAGSPTRELSKQFEQAKKAASQLTNSADQKLLKLRLMTKEMQAAGINTRKLAEHEKDLRSQITSTTAKIDDQQKMLAKRQRISNAQQHAENARALAGKFAVAGAGSVAAGMVLGKPVAVTVKEFAKAEDSATQLKVALMRAGGVVPPEFEKINALAMKLGDRLPGYSGSNHSRWYR